MLPETNAKLLLRQLRDIQTQADKIVRGDSSSEAIENFARYSGELQHYILSRTDCETLRANAARLPEIKYKRMQARLWQLLLLPLGLLFFYKDQIRRAALVTQIGEVKNAYAKMERLLREETE